MRLLQRLVQPFWVSKNLSTPTHSSDTAVSKRFSGAGGNSAIGCVRFMSSMVSNLGKKKNSRGRVSEVSIGEDSLGMVEFKLSSWSSLVIQKGDITDWFVDSSSDAIVNAANKQMLGGGGAVDEAIHRVAGPELKKACYKVPEVHPGVRCPAGDARITPGFELPASHVIHAVGSVYDVDEKPSAILRNAYRNSLCVARENNIQYVAFPAVSCGLYRFPYDEAADIAISTVQEYADDFWEIHFVLFSDEIYQSWLVKAYASVGW